MKRFLSVTKMSVLSLIFANLLIGGKVQVDTLSESVNATSFTSWVKEATSGVTELPLPENNPFFEKT